MNYYNKRLNLTAEPAKLNPENYCVNIDGELRLIHKSLIEGSADWQAQPDWVITAFKVWDGDMIATLTSGGGYSVVGDIIDGVSLDTMFECNHPIHSVRRSDGVEFKVGDKTLNGIVDGFRLMGDDMDVRFVKGAINDFGNPYICAHIAIDAVLPAPAVLFTTHDGVEITNQNQQVFYVTEELELFDDPASIAYKPHYTCKYFSTQEAAENYIAENKPLYSLADIRKAWDEIDFISYTELIEQLKQVK